MRLRWMMAGFGLLLLQACAQAPEKRGEPVPRNESAEMQSAAVEDTQAEPRRKVKPPPWPFPQSPGGFHRSANLMELLSSSTPAGRLKSLMILRQNAQVASRLNHRGALMMCNLPGYYRCLDITQVQCLEDLHNVQHVCFEHVNPNPKEAIDASEFHRIMTEYTACMADSHFAIYPEKAHVVDQCRWAFTQDDGIKALTILLE